MFFRGLTFYYKNNIYISLPIPSHFPPVHRSDAAKLCPQRFSHQEGPSIRKAVLLGVSSWISLVTAARQPAIPYITLRCCLGIRQSEVHQGHAGPLMTNDNHRVSTSESFSLTFCQNPLLTINQISSTKFILEAVKMVNSSLLGS